MFHSDNSTNMESPIAATSKTEDNGIEITQHLTKCVTHRLRKEDDEEHWISGEELNTDESSDEDGKKDARRKHKRDHKGARPKEKSLLKSSDTLPKPALAVPELSDSDVEEPPIDISWKPKRGSIKLPHMTKDLEMSPSSSSKSTEPIVE